MWVKHETGVCQRKRGKEMGCGVDVEGGTCETDCEPVSKLVIPSFLVVAGY